MEERRLTVKTVPIERFSGKIKLCAAFQSLSIRLFGFAFCLCLIALCIPQLSYSDPISCNEIPQLPNTVSEIQTENNLIIVVPHPDDEILGFAGLIHNAKKQGKKVKVIIITDGDAYWDACQFWLNGSPNGNGCSVLDMEDFAKIRQEESKEALARLVVLENDITFLGYPDGQLQQMYIRKNEIVIPNTQRPRSYTGKQFTGESLEKDLEQLFNQYTKASVFTTDSRDHHADHSSLFSFVLDAIRSSSKNWEVYSTIIHEPLPAGDDCNWPYPVVTCTRNRGTVSTLREKRYCPISYLTPPKTAEVISFLALLLDNVLWEGDSPLKRKLIDTYKTQIGLRSRNGLPIGGEYAGWVDWHGYLISFVRKNELFIKNDPMAPRHLRIREQ
jgi:LmbE family N-acetylglucosaminyl deacetylase